MNTLEALFFPGTEIYSASQFPLFLLFEKLHLLLPVESAGLPDDGADIFNSSGLCQAHTPSPLGEDRERFEHLIGDIRERKDDYAAQLSSLTVASLTDHKKSVDDSSGGIMATLLGKPQIAEDDEEQENHLLWQARLVLKIGEILDREEEEVAMQMALLEDDEGGLFRELQGEMDEDEESLFSELVQLKTKMSRPTAGAIGKRLSAWSTLHSQGFGSSPKIWLTTMEEAADELLERYEEAMKLPPVCFFKLSLPANIGWNREEALHAIGEFRENNRAIYGDIEKVILEQGSAETVIHNWDEALEAVFPAAETGRVEVEFYRLSSMSCAELLDSEDTETSSLLAAVRWREN